MKNILTTLVLVIGAMIFSRAQTDPISTTGLQLSLRAGYDLPLFENNTPFIDYKAGPVFGTSIDYYWNWFGIGFDFDYINSGTENLYPTGNILNSRGVPLTSFTIQEDKITRLFYGIGPDFRYVSTNRKFQTELNARIGLSSIKGGEVALIETTTSPNQLLNYHAGYDLSASLTAKAQLRFIYFPSGNIGFHAGAYYLKHFDGTELVNPSTGISAGYAPLASTNGPTGAPIQTTGPFVFRNEACNCDLSSIGVFVGLTLKLGAKTKSVVVCEDDIVKKKEEPCCGTCPVYGLAVTARDKFTKEVLPETDIAIKNAKGEIVRTGKTNSFGVVIFEKIVKDDYTVSGLLANVALIESAVKKDELICDQVLQKEVIYGDRNFIIKGRAFECNTTTPIAGINVTLENKDVAVKKSTMTDSQGNFLLNLPETGIYDLYGRKENYFSQIEKVTSSDYNREKNLFVKLEMCAEKADCGSAINLKNILFDLDKYVIKDAAKLELNKLVRFMIDNPTVTVEVGSHTDCRSSNAYNQTLSQNRASASVDYVVSQGISRSRITGKGYGETVLLNECADGVNCSEAQHSINRRTEMKVICPEGSKN